MCGRATTETPHAERAAAALGAGARLRARLTPERWRHTLSVAETAYRLAGALGWDAGGRERALVAGLLHDAAKDLPEAELRELAADDEELPWLLHAVAGARVAERELGVRDEAVLRAIAFHPTGSAEDCPLTELLFVADYLEPGRLHLDEEDRALLRKALGGAIPLRDLFCHILRKKLQHVLSKGRPVHPRSVAAWNGRCGGASGEATRG